MWWPSNNVSPWPTGLNRLLRSFAYVHARVQSSSPAAGHTGMPHLLWNTALGMGRSTVTCSYSFTTATPHVAGGVGPDTACNVAATRAQTRRLQQMWPVDVRRCWALTPDSRVNTRKERSQRFRQLGNSDTRTQHCMQFVESLIGYLHPTTCTKNTVKNRLSNSDLSTSLSIL